MYFRYYSTRATTFVNSVIALAGGPRGIRTLDLLNAIETRSQLRYGPSFIVTVNTDFQIVHSSLPSGPEGIRTPDLLSAIEARSQLRYRPKYKANDILL